MHSNTWSDIAAHRERLLRIARRRCPTREDAEDIVSEAMLRCATFEGLDPERIEQFLTAVTVRLCADHYRKAERRGRALVKLASDPDVTPGPEDELLGGVDAQTLDALLASLPDRQRAVLFDRAHGLSVTQIASRHELTYKATESALARARGAMRAALAGAFGAAVAFVRWVRPKRAVAALVLPAVTLVVAATVVRIPLDGGAPEAAAPHDVPWVNELPRRVVQLADTVVAAKPVTAAPRLAPAGPARPSVASAKKDEDPEVDLSEYNPNLPTVEVDDDKAPQDYALDCVEYGYYPVIDWDAEHWYEGHCDKGSPLYEGREP